MRGKKKDFLYFFTMNYASFVVVFIISSEDVFQVEKAFDPDGSVFFIEWFDLLRKVILLDPLSLSLFAHHFRDIAFTLVPTFPFQINNQFAFFLSALLLCF